MTEVEFLKRRVRNMLAMIEGLTSSCEFFLSRIEEISDEDKRRYEKMLKKARRNIDWYKRQEDGTYVEDGIVANRVRNDS